MTLQEFFSANPKTALAFSGGVDSAYLLYAGRRFGADVKPYFVKTAFQPLLELEDAQRLAGEVGADLTVLETDILSCPGVAKNAADRCYRCKRALFGALKERAAADGYAVLIDGTNASDDEGDRAGMRALRQMVVRSPLRECGVTKTEIRRLSKEAGLFTWDKPAYACLATRIPKGAAITAEALAKVERAEDGLKKLGFSDLRVRLIGAAARLQLPEDQLERALAMREEILRLLAHDFGVVLLDLKPR